MGSPSTDDSASVIGHGKVNMETNSLAVVTTVTSDTKWKDNSARGEAEDFRAIELNDVERLGRTIGRSICGLGGVRIIPLGAHTLGQLSGDTFCLCKDSMGKDNEDSEIHTSRPWQLEQQTTRE